MSLRTTFSRTSASLASSSRAAPLRAFSSSPSRRAGHGDEHGSAGPTPDDTQTHESWWSRPFRNTFIVVAIGAIAWPYLPERFDKNASSFLSPDEFNKLRDPNFTDAPLLTRWIVRYLMTPAEVTRAKNAAHLEDVMEKAEGRLLFQDAQMRKFRTLNFDPSIPTGSSYGVQPGTQVDMSDFKPRQD